MSAVGIDEGAVRRGIDRYEELTCEGENPRTTLVVLRSEVTLPDEAACAELSEASSEVMDLLSTATTGVMVLGADTGCCGVIVASGARGGRLLRESGSRSFFSLIVITIFSRSSGVMCRSRPRLRLCTESCRWIWGRVISTGAEVEVEVLSVSNSRASSSASESRLPDRLGTSAEYRPSELLAEMEMAGVVELASEIGSQQKVSLFHNRQLKFSSLRPSSNEPAHLENTANVSLFVRHGFQRTLTCPHAEEILDVSSVNLVD